MMKKSDMSFSENQYKKFNDEYQKQSLLKGM